MKTISKILSVAVVAFAIVLSSCGKYPDGPKISLKTKMARITRVWKDATNSSSGTIEYKKDGTVASNGNVVAGYTWKFSSDKKNLEETYTIGGISGTGSSQILRLTSKDLWLQASGSSSIDKLTAQ